MFLFFLNFTSTQSAENIRKKKNEKQEEKNKRKESMKTLKRTGNVFIFNLARLNLTFKNVKCFPDTWCINLILHVYLRSVEYLL